MLNQSQASKNLINVSNEYEQTMRTAFDTIIDDINARRKELRELGERIRDIDWKEDFSHVLEIPGINEQVLLDAIVFFQSPDKATVERILDLGQDHYYVTSSGYGC